MRKIVENEIKALDQATSILSGADRSAYAWWLAQTYYYVCHSTRLLALASSRFGRGSEDDLHYRFSEHVGEEKGHEFLASRDLKNMGLDIRDFEELSETQAFYQSQYYWIEHVHPIAFFGYVLCLEAYSLNGARKIYKDAQAAFGDKASTFLKVHVQEDVDHLEKALRLVERLNTKQQAIVLQNFKLSCELYASIYRKITERIARGEFRQVA